MRLLKLLVGLSVAVGVGATLLASIIFRKRSTDDRVEPNGERAGIGPRRRHPGDPQVTNPPGPSAGPRRHHPGDPQVTNPPRPPAADE